MGNGLSVFTPAFDIDDSLRTASCLETKDHVGIWNNEGMADFDPERWMVTQPNGTQIFDQNAGPLLTFGLGERGCYGKRMAYMEMKLFTSIFFWNFKFHKCLNKTSGYAAIDKVTHTPQSYYIRPVKINNHSS